MRPLALLVLAVAPLAGCAGPEASGSVGDCREGAGQFFLFVFQNKDFFSSPEELAKDRFHTLSHGGAFFGLVATPKPGTGLILGDEGNFTNVTRNQVRDQLVASGVWAEETDYVVEEAWQAELPESSFASLCVAILEEGDPDYPEGGERMGCADGGTRVYHVSTADRAWERTVGCLSDASVAEYESGARIEQAFREAELDARATVGLA
jgi:hypothetical protein